MKKIFRIRIVDQRELSYAAGYYSTWQEANLNHDKATYQCPYWKGIGVTIVETIIEELKEH